MLEVLFQGSSLASIFFIFYLNPVRDCLLHLEWIQFADPRAKVWNWVSKLIHAQRRFYYNFSVSCRILRELSQDIYISPFIHLLGKCLNVPLVYRDKIVISKEVLQPRSFVSLYFTWFLMLINTLDLHMVFYFILRYIFKNTFSVTRHAKKWHVNGTQAVDLVFYFDHWTVI